MIEPILHVTLAVLAIAMIGLIYRLVKGPTVPDRVIALDAMGINLVSITAVLSMILDTSNYLDVILLIGILAFIGTVAFAKFLEKGEVIEYDRDQ
ncbi:Na(+)/H(+) antiporter subunit F1 [Domibacillus enclensis]|uniref:Multisubunit sodium/proton antiporter, MrpF subunit n=1 Tax=Domibacillus enclensis TaxID=1017273 RepID=A0A1N6YF33_9BACI|nr:Na(+)/H(+) antiporter subunit F1 [Domibacillus enclensis]OXS77610.1 Na(+)/H(+) antiporter subunit F [Domibacillus enclensis]SIR13232.1 multisubunit sodium/proton antiporter, MrpF subunit [Domibacillus enclensis]